MYCPSDVERVRRETAIADIVSETVELSPRGTDLWGKCPFHDDPIPSFKASSKWGTWRCWNCGHESGVIDFVMLRDGVDRQEAIRLLADRAGAKLREKAPVTNDLPKGCELIGKVASELAWGLVQRDLHSPSELLKTGYQCIDRLLGRLRPAEMIVVSSRPGVGKTSFAVSLTRCLAYQGAAVVFFTLGMKKEEVVARMLSAQSGVHLDGLLFVSERSQLWEVLEC